MMKTNTCTAALVQFRHRLYQNFTNRADTLMELVDALCSNASARSVVELCLTPCFRRTYTSLYKALAESTWQQGQLARLLAPDLPRPRQRSFWLLGVDVTPQPRPFAHTLADRALVYQPNPIAGNTPITIGHQYSTVALLPENQAHCSASWVVPLATARVASAEDKEAVGAAQIDALLQDPSLPFQNQLCVEVADSKYSKPAYLHAHRKHTNLVTIVRVAANRTFYRAAQSASEPAAAGHPRWYGARFSLSDPTSWPPCDSHAVTQHVSRRGKRYRVELMSWNNCLMRGKKKPKPLPMQRYPFTLVRIVFYDQAGRQAFGRPLWLIVIGERRHELNAFEIYHAYSQRYDLEHFFRFGKQHLVLDGFQTAEVEREESWWQLAHLAYAQLWLARELVEALPRPWERNLASMQRRQISPSLAQRDFGRIIRQIGTPAAPPKVRGISTGRRLGTRLAPRPRQKVVIKGHEQAQAP
jgi:DDE superfamily endonuclease